MSEEFDFQIMGAGSLGSLFGGMLSKSGFDVNLVGREEHVEEVENKGLRVGGIYDFVTYPSASVKPRKAEVSVLTVKAFDTRTAAGQLKGMQRGVVSLQNGMGNEEVLSEVLEGSEVIAGTTTWGANLVEPGFVECTGEGETDLGSVNGGETGLSKKVAEAMRKADMEAYSRDDMPRRLWEKLGVNAGINPVTALTQLTNGDALKTSENTMREAAKEVAKVANSVGDLDHDLNLEPGRVAEKMVEVAESTAGNESSMLQDVKKGRRTEIDAINGYVVKKAENESDVKVNRTLTQLVKGTEFSYLDDCDDSDPEQKKQRGGMS